MTMQQDTIRIGMFDLNSTNNREVVATNGAEICLVEALSLTTWSTAVLTVYRSLDGITPYALETAQTLTASNLSATVDSAGFPFLIIQLTTNAGSAIYATIRVTRSRSTL